MKPSFRTFTVLATLGVSFVMSMATAQTTAKQPLILQIWKGTQTSLSKLIGKPRVDKTKFGSPDYLQGWDFFEFNNSFKKLLPSAIFVSLNLKGKTPKSSRLSIGFTEKAEVSDILKRLGMSGASVGELQWAENKRPDEAKYATSFQFIKYPKISKKQILFSSRYSDGVVTSTELIIEDPWQ